MSAVKDAEPERKVRRVRGKDRPVIWEPTPKQAEFLSAPERECLYGGSLGGGKRDALLACGLLDYENPRHRAIFFRRSFPQLRSVIERSHELYRPLGGIYNVQTSQWTFPSGAKIEFAFLDSDSDKWRYAGRSFNLLLWDEICEWENSDSYIYLLTRLRTTKNSGLRLMVRASANPLGRGATWVRSRWQIPGDGGPSTCADLDTGFHRRFVPARVEDNIHLLGSDYVQMLQSLPSSQRKALLEGRWDCVAGSMFEAFSNDRHVCDEFAIPATWEIWRGGDDGFNAPASIHWITQDPDSETYYVIGEIYARGVLPDVLGERIIRFDNNIPVDFGDEIGVNDLPLKGAMDSASFSNTGTGQKSRGQQMNHKGCQWRPVEKPAGSRVMRCQMMHQVLAPNPRNRKDKNGVPYPGMMFFRKCTNAIRTIPALPISEHDPEDVDSNAETHAFDSITYALSRQKTWFRRVRVTR